MSQSGGRTPWRAAVLVTLVTLALVGAAVPGAGAGPAGNRVDRASQGNQASQGNHGPWWCTADDPMPMPHSDDDMEHYHDPKGPLSKADCRSLTADLREARRYALQFPTAADAVAAGFRMIVPYLEGMGAHYIGPSGFGVWNATRPNFLLYGGNGGDAPLVGLMWIVRSAGMPPEGFAGGNDHFHRHQALCMVNGLIVAEGLTDAQCAARGGFNVDMRALWLLHVWFVPGWQYKPDVFRAHHPELGPVPPA